MGGGAVQLEPVAADKRVHIAFVDGLRGVAALYVVLGHVYAYTRVWAEPLLPKPVHVLLKFIDQGHSAVAVFIVISGFCLMMPLSRRQLGTPQGGTGRFLQKRARRILPPYYAALVLSILLVAVVGSIRSAQDLGAKSIGFHALLVHNLDRTTMFTINGPLWSVVLECQIYVLFALVLLPVYRRYGFPALLGTAFAFGLVPFAVLPSAWDLGWTFPWYLGLFGLGCLASHIVFSPAPAYARARAWRGWAPASAVSIAVVVLVVGFVLGPALRQLWAFDTLVGIAAALLIVHLALSSLDRDESATPSCPAAVPGLPPHGGARSVLLQPVPDPRTDPPGAGRLAAPGGGVPGAGHGARGGDRRPVGRGAGVRVLARLRAAVPVELQAGRAGWFQRPLRWSGWASRGAAR